MSEKLRLDLPVLLPNIPGEADACVQRLQQLLRNRPGVDDVHVRPGAEEKPPQLCIHYDPDQLSLTRIRELAKAAGAEISSRFGHLQWQLDGMNHQRKAGSVVDRLQKMEGVLEANANASGLLHIEFDREKTSEDVMRAELSSLGASPREGEEDHSAHPLAAAIAKDGRERLGQQPIPTASNLENLIGRGVTATVGGQTVWIGKAELFGSDGIAPLGASAASAIERLREAGRTSMVVRMGERDLGAIGLLDTPREGARDALKQLRELGITRMIMISGDHKKVAEAVAREVGLDEAWGDLMPEDKVEAIRKLREKTKVAMVGDGVNDAPAMANATVGIAMGAAGSDVALETADVALMADDLRNLPFAVGLSRHTRSVIRQNVFVSLGIVAVLVPATIMGLGIGAAVAVHEGSTLLVVFNALRLLAYKGRDKK